MAFLSGGNDLPVRNYRYLTIKRTINLEAAAKLIRKGKRVSKGSRRDERVAGGRDDMNLAEFPLASLDDRLPKDQKTLVFEDQIHVKGTPVTRRLTISASDKYGLPTALDDEVILGLIQLTRRTDFSEKRVEFTRYELIRLLGWRDEGKSYQRIDESLKRWLGVSLYYDKAWWDKEEQSWVSESFHILDNVTLYDKERYARRKKMNGPSGAYSSFSWNEIVFRSFRAGYLKKLDLRIYRALESAVAKRLYRFIDKHFYKKPRWEFDLHTLCFDKLGMARTDHTGELKRRLNVGIRELEEQGTLKRMTDDERFRKEGVGRWTVILEKCSDDAKKASATSGGLVDQLVERGLSRNSAEELVQTRTPEVISDRIKFYDWLKKRRDPRAARRPAGFLAQSIRDEYPLPEDYIAETKRNTLVDRNREVQRKVAPKPDDAEEPSVDEDRKRYLAHFSTLPTNEQEQLEKEALAGASRVHAESYERLKGATGPLFEQLRKEILVAYLRSKESPRQTSGPSEVAEVQELAAGSLGP